ncbi:HIT domain-containing protein [Photobacterium sp. WH77]|uniref:HIT domain-containing protein n=1 Tax=Photobacterium arenosum TaxID=2774143 RepID=A0ABR9BIP0_9GAMM|nr:MULTISPECIES: HIT domain-containing protein [Photobacterium]MBD8512415.1 HIT domain-containing protein [Photobacterium arenosum]MBV7260775.1 HIT domain-containing protein [Photobacterium sp. WH24]MCG2835885.1 HIT domain-containing protein [Photobacterium sp. WH77]MCG2843438.1 HIT domain-containing protein [Photobacterium sp. WH80]MDO6579925.1 HIT domain-containing protein [Photobacterium sp. 2_MG-2023]
MSFTLHPRLSADTQWIGDLPLCRVLLSKEAIGPWLILVPRYDALREIHHMSAVDQQQLMVESSSTAQLLETYFSPDKINIGALGNLVPQLHVHHIARFTTDIAWPGPVWGNTDGSLHSEDEQQQLVERLQLLFGQVNGFTPA